MRLAQIPRAEFIEGYWEYNPGEAVSFIEPTQGGKTTLACQLLQVTCTPSLPGVMLVMKPRDRVPAMWTRRMGWRETGTWPPPGRWPWQEKPSGYTLWPRQSLTDIKRDREHLTTQFRKALTATYSRGNQIAFADEVYGLCTLGLQPELEALWTQGSGMGAAVWTATQKPSGTQSTQVPTWMYSAPAHLFLGRDPDRRNRQRFGEIGGVDPRLVEDAVEGLQYHEVTTPYGTRHISDKLYIRKGGPAGAYMCVVTGP